jgi:hypothetical protein
MAGWVRFISRAALVADPVVITTRKISISRLSI